jgi:hypothetical protein
MLRSVRDQVLHSSHDVVKESRSIDEFAEARNLSGNSSPDLRLAVFQELHESGHKISCYNLIIYCFCDLQKVSQYSSAEYPTNLFESVSHHVSDTPALVFNQTPQRRKKDTMT